MGDEEFINWIKKAEQEAVANPSRYRRKVGFFALAGYAYIFVLIGLALAALAGLVAFVYFRESHGGNVGIVKLGAVLVIFLWTIFAALWVTFEPPSGRRVTAKEFPRLFAEIDDLTTKLKTIPIHEVVVVPECNAFVSQTPRLGIFGWHRNTLGVGLELMLILTPPEMRAVIAHELGHLSGNHSKFGGWIYRVRKTWSNLFDRFAEQQRWGNAVIEPFFRWYAPRFAAYSFVLRRQNEYEADAASAELTNANTAASALIKSSVFGNYLDATFWHQLFASADEVQRPQQLAYRSLAHHISAGRFDTDRLTELYQGALNEKTDYDDTHPALTDRLSALGIRSDPNMQMPGTYRPAAYAWFGDGLPGLVDELDREWWNDVEPRWTANYQKIQNERAELARLQASAGGGLEQMQHWRFGALTAKHHGDAEALPIFRAYQNTYPDDFDAAFIIGRLLRNAGDGSCVAEWAKVPRQHPAFVQANSEAARFLEGEGRQAEADRLWQLAQARHDELAAIEEEQNSVTEEDTLLAPEMSQENLDNIRSRLKTVGFVGAAWLAQKATKHDQSAPIYVVAYRLKWVHMKRIVHLDPEAAGADAVREALSHIDTGEDPMHVFVTEYQPVLGDKLGKKVKKIGIRIL